jgi:putative transposase
MPTASPHFSSLLRSQHNYVRAMPALKLQQNLRQNPIKILQVKYLNNIIEQDHRFVKRIKAPMLGFKAFHSAEATLAGIETTHMIRKGQLHANGLTAFQQFVALAA